MEVIDRLIDRVGQGDRKGSLLLIEEGIRLNPDTDVVTTLLDPFLNQVGSTWQRGECTLAQAYVATKVTEETLNRFVPSPGDTGPATPKKGPAVETPEEFLTLPVPDPDTTPLLRSFIEGTRLTREVAGPDLPVGGIVLNPFDLIAVVIGLETWIDTLLFREDILPQVFANTSSDFVDFSKALLENGASFIVSSGGVINTTVLPRHMVEQIVVPMLRETFSRVSAPVIIHNGGGSITPSMDLFHSLPNVAGMVVNEGNDQTVARRLAGEDALLVCGLDAPTLHRRSPREIRKSTSAVLKGRAGDRCIAIGTTGPDPGCETTSEHVLAMKSAVCATGP